MYKHNLSHYILQYLEEVQQLLVNQSPFEIMFQELLLDDMVFESVVVKYYYQLLIEIHVQLSHLTLRQLDQDLLYKNLVLLIESHRTYL